MIKCLALEWQAHMLWLAHSHSWYNVGLHLNGIQPYKEWHIKQASNQASKKTDFTIVLL